MWAARQIIENRSVDRMREFEDEQGKAWTASVAERQDQDYKGRFSLMLHSDGEGAEERVSLSDVRWNSQRTAERALEVMSETELRRLLRSATGRAGVRSP